MNVVLVTRVTMVVLDAQAQRQLSRTPEVLRYLEVRPIRRRQVGTEPVTAGLVHDRGEAEGYRVLHVVREAPLHAGLVS